MAKAKEDVQAEAVEEEVKVALIDTPIGAAFTKNVDDKTEDEVKMQMIAAGSTFKSVTRQFNELMIESGRAMSKKDRDENVELIAAEYDLADENDFNQAVSDVIDAVSGTTEKSAAAALRAYGRKNEIDTWKKPKGEGKSGFASLFYGILATGPVSEEDAIAFIQGSGDNAETSPNVKNHQSHYMAIHGLVQQVRAA